MDFNQVTVQVHDFHVAVRFYETLGLKCIVSAREEYARFELPSGDSTFSLYVANPPKIGGIRLYFEVENVDALFADLTAKGIVFDSPPCDQRWLWREAGLRDPSGNQLCLYHAGTNRKHPPWRLSDA